MKLIKSFENIDILVDDEDYDFLNKITWTVDQKSYVFIKTLNGVQLENKERSIHRLIMNPPKDKYVDHIDGNRLNNTKENLRICTPTENSRNRKTQEKYKGKPTSSKYKGVYWLNNLQKWKVQIRYPTNEKLHLGYFDDEVAATNCYNYWAKIYYGEFANLNEIPYMEKEEWEKLKRNNDSSKFTGVCWITNKGKWLAQIWDGKKNIRIGIFDEEIEAAKAYNEFAIRLRGDKARLNDIPNSEAL